MRPARVVFGVREGLGGLSRVCKTRQDFEGLSGHQKGSTSVWGRDWGGGGYSSEYYQYHCQLSRCASHPAINNRTLSLSSLSRCVCANRQMWPSKMAQKHFLSKVGIVDLRNTLTISSVIIVSMMFGCDK